VVVEDLQQVEREVLVDLVVEVVVKVVMVLEQDLEDLEILQQ